MSVSSKPWKEEHVRNRLRGQGASCRVLNAWMGDSVNILFAEVCVRLSEPPLAMPLNAQNFFCRALAFRCFSRVACAAHTLLRKPRGGYPFKLFSALVEDVPFAAVLADRPCLYDELTQQFMKQFSPLDNEHSKRQALDALETLAACIEVDIASVECKHASIRRTTHQCSLQTWLATLEDVNADWISRQLSLNLSRHISRRQAAQTKHPL